MKEELQDKLVEILSSIQSAAGKASDLAMEQLPDIALSYIAYGRTIETVEVGVFALLLSVGVWGCVYAATKKNWVQTSTYAQGWPDSRVVLMVMAGLLSVFGFIGTVLNLPQMVLVWLSPKVWLLKEIATMLK